MAAMRWGWMAVAIGLAGTPALAATPVETGRRVDFDGAIDGSHAIRLLDERGALVRELHLADFLPAEFVDALPREQGRLRWMHGAARQATPDSVDFVVDVPGAVDGAVLHFSIDLRDGLLRTTQLREYLAAADRARALVAAPSAAIVAGSR